MTPQATRLRERLFSMADQHDDQHLPDPKGDPAVRDLCREAAALLDQRAGAVPEGWPTEAMVDASRKAITERYYAGGNVVQMTPIKPREMALLVLNAAFTAAPEPPASPPFATPSTPNTAALAEVIAEAHKIARTAEMSAGIMRDNKRTGGWEGADRTASAFDRIAVRTYGLKHLLAALRTPAASSADAGRAGWRPIETWESQPTGQAHPVILCVSDGGEHEPAIGEAWFDPDAYGGTWWWAGTGIRDYHASPICDTNHGVPSHWMPVPDAPAETGRRAAP